MREDGCPCPSPQSELLSLLREAAESFVGAQYPPGVLREEEACSESFARLSAACRRCQEEMAWELTLAEDRERQRIAGVLHDQVGQSLASAQLKLRALGAELPEELAPRVDEIVSLLQEILKATRSLTFKIGNPLLHEAGLEAALESLGVRLGADYGLRAELASDVDSERLPENAKLILYRVLSELMSNAARHADATTLRVALCREGNRLVVSVEDDGVGIPAGLKTPSIGSSGLGLYLSEKRLATLGGRLVIDKERQRGTRVVVEVPLP